VKKILTREQAQTSKDRAARFELNVLQDPDKAHAIEDESLDNWVERKKSRSPIQKGATRAGSAW